MKHLALIRCQAVRTSSRELRVGRSDANGGFTLIEMSIVLVVIGLVIGGVLVGRDLVGAAAVRAQLAQIDKYNRAVNTFYGKYGALPGDMNAATASAFGFTPRGQYAGEGDGNGVIEGISGNCAACNNGIYVNGGETAMFWVDLSTANGLNLNLIDESLSLASPTSIPAVTITGTAINSYFPAARIGANNDLYVWSGNIGSLWGGSSYITINGNFYGLSAITSIPSVWLWSNPGLTVKAAYAMDAKIDDGFPLSGNVLALYVTGAGLRGAQGGACCANTNGGAITASPTSCYDSNGVNFVRYQYSVNQSNGNGVNCALSFHFQ